MKRKPGQMSGEAKEQYIEGCRARYLRRNRQGKSALIDEVVEMQGWDRKHAIKVLNGKAGFGKAAQKRGSKPSYGDEEKAIIVTIWKHSEQPCGVRLKETLPLWKKSYERCYGEVSPERWAKILGYSARTLERMTAQHRASGKDWRGRKTGRTSNRLKKIVPVRCGPQLVDQPGWLEADTVSHGGGSSSGQFMHSLTLTDLYSGWTELAALWGNSSGEVRIGVEKIERRMPFEMLGFDCDNGSEFLNEILEHYLWGRSKRIDWTRSRPYKKNDQAHVEQKNYTHVRLLLGYGRFSDIELKILVDELYELAWLPLRNYFTPVMKLVEKQRVGSKVRKRYDKAATPCDRLLSCAKVSEETKEKLRQNRASYDPLMLSQDIENRLKEIFGRVERIERDRAEEWARAGEIRGSAEIFPAARCVTASVAIAPVACTPRAAGKKLVKQSINQQITNKSLVS